MIQAHRLLFALTMVLGACATNDDAGPRQPLTSDACAALTHFEIGVQDIGLPTRGARIGESVFVDQSESAPAHCLASGTIAPVDPSAPSIGFQVALPAQWNGNVVMLGGGGFNGVVPNVTGGFYNMASQAPSPLQRGYAVFAGDGGHQVSGAEPGAFLLNEEAYWNWIGDALKKTRDAAVAAIQETYGASPSRAYFIGGSSGGREGLMVAGRWPKDWNGIVSLYPARNQMTHMIGGMAINRAWMRPGAFLSAGERGLLFRAALERCDGLDGLADGVISNVRGCNAVFSPATATLSGAPLRCVDATPPAGSCLSDAQLAALATMNEPLRIAFPMESGATNFPGFNIHTSDSGVPSASPMQPMVSYLALGSAPPAYPATQAMSLSAQFGDNFIRYAIAGDPSFNPLSIDPSAPGRFAARMSALSAFDASDEDLSAFANRGGKVILLHGTADLIVTPRMTEAYYARLQETMGRRSVDRFLRYYEVPGFGHAISTNFNLAWDYLSALERWAEEGVDPGENEVAIDTIGEPGRARPLCRYPRWPRYNGQGDVSDASSFTCAE